MNILGCFESTINKFVQVATSYLKLKDICSAIKDLPKDDPKATQIINCIKLEVHYKPKEITKLMTNIRTGALGDLPLDIKTILFNKVFRYFEKSDKFRNERKFFIIFGKTNDEISCEYCKVDDHGKFVLPRIIIDFIDQFGILIVSSKIEVKKWQVKKLFLGQEEIPLRYPTDNLPDGLIGTNLENTIRNFLFSEIICLDIKNPITITTNQSSS